MKPSSPAPPTSDRPESETDFPIKALSGASAGQDRDGASVSGERKSPPTHGARAAAGADLGEPESLDATTAEEASHPDAQRLSRLDRRRFLMGLGLLGAAQVAPSMATESTEDPRRALDGDDLSGAERLMDVEMTNAERQLMLEDLADLRESYNAIRQVKLDNGVSPALVFAPLAIVSRGPRASSGTSTSQASSSHSEPGSSPDPDASPIGAPGAEDELAFLPLHRQAEMLRQGEVTSVELTQVYLDRLEKYDPLLHCVIHRTTQRALEEAEKADALLAKGKDLGPLHGIPWGAKDLLAARGYPTTWGAQPYVDQSFDEDAAAVARLGDAGAVLVAKLSLGALAWGDVWFDAMTRNPWNPEQGSSGSSAGSASATAAGLVSFALGSETWGSIVSPCTRCGVTGLRPTFGLVSRHGAMALSWSMDKLGPIARDVSDCALVLEHISGPDPRDPAVVGTTFHWNRHLDPTKLRVGVVRSAFEEEREDTEWKAHDLQTLSVLEGLGMDLVDVELPIDDLPLDSLGFLLSVEAAAAFDELTRSGQDDLLVRQIREAWPNVFRQARFIPAVEYLQANRVRTLLCQRMAAFERSVDVYICPTYGVGNLLLTNLTGHPCVVLPNGFRDDGTPTSITFNGRLFGENEVIAVARAYQQATDFHTRRPTLDLTTLESNDTP